ncbi:phage terminase Nu1 subunit (DNA packaging protein) [Azospirillum fermentarium]|uniref:terminase small subunit n=1 Tax=Azospirillum fermentarium TaxID=1233114 RepID=UPI002226A518|nr:terminase small subunit [Azospirillum fermentarium]MCW2248282.1 phage terminase Nu1 subunit (DNA packaging protein) [Azospirillum fermentarium]
MKVNRAGLADCFGVSLPTVDAWLRKGMPFERRGARGVDWQFDTADVAKWREEQVQAAVDDALKDLSIDQLQKRKLMAETSILERRDRLEAKEIFEGSDVERLIAEAVGKCRTRFLAIPTDAADLLVGMTSAAEVRAVLDRLVLDALAELAAMDGIAGTDQDDGDDGAEAGGDDREAERPKTGNRTGGPAKGGGKR